MTAGLVAALALGGCSSDNGSGAGGAGASSGDGGASSTSGTGGATSSGTGGEGGGGPSCSGPGFGGNATDQDVESADATVVDADGNPVEGVLVQLCGVDICLSGNTAADGTVHIDAGRTMKKPAFKWGDGVTYAKIGAPLTGATFSPTEPLVAVPLPDLATGAALVAGEPATSGDVTVTIAAGASIEIDTLTNDTPEKERFRAVEIPVDVAKPAFDPALPTPELVFALAPLDTVVCPAAAVSVPNTAGFAAGDDVEFYLHGLETYEEYAPYGGWAKVSDGKVTADGTRIETAPEGGLPVLGVIGIHKK